MPVESAIPALQQQPAPPLQLIEIPISLKCIQAAI